MYSMASKLIKFCIINHHILPFLKKITTYLDEKPQLRSAKKEITLGSIKQGINHLSAMGAVTSKGENCSCSAMGVVTSNGALTISVVAVSVSRVGSVVVPTFFEEFVRQRRQLFGQRLFLGVLRLHGLARPVGFISNKNILS